MPLGREYVDPAAREGYGFPLVIHLHRAGTVTKGPAELACYVVGAALQNSKGAVLRLTSFMAFFGTNDGANDGTKKITVALLINGVVVGSLQIATNLAAPVIGVADLTDSAGNGIAVLPGDRISCQLPTNAGNDNPKDLTVQVTAEAFGIVG